MRFSIDTQHSILQNWCKELQFRKKKLEKVERIPELRYTLATLDAAHTLFKSQTKTMWGYIKSFPPFIFSFAYRCRVAYHNRIVEACDKLQQLQKNIEKAEKLSPINIPRRTCSAPELPAFYPSPIKYSNKMQRSESVQDFNQHSSRKFVFN